MAAKLLSTGTSTKRNLVIGIAIISILSYLSVCVAFITGIHSVSFTAD